MAGPWPITIHHAVAEDGVTCEPWRSAALHGSSGHAGTGRDRMRDMGLVPLRRRKAGPISWGPQSKRDRTETFRPQDLPTRKAPVVGCRCTAVCELRRPLPSTCMPPVLPRHQ